eukprot:scaffold1154_cov310-Pinguiococcus_pyrenoidosus.AAC.42
MSLPLSTEPGTRKGLSRSSRLSRASQPNVPVQGRSAPRRSGCSSRPKARLSCPVDAGDEPGGWLETRDRDSHMSEGSAG